MAKYQSGGFFETLEPRALFSASYAYTMTDLGSLGGGFASPSGINDSGVVVGMSSDSTDTEYPVEFANGKVTAIGPTGYKAAAINGNGKVVGSGGNQLFIDNNGKVKFITPPPEYTLYRVYDVNNGGEICGDWKLANGHLHAFIYNPATSTFTDLGTLGGSPDSMTTDMSYASSINDAGQAEGDSINAQDLDHCFIYTNGKMQDLGTFGGPASSGEGINNLGHAVGTSQLNVKSSTSGVGYVSDLFYYNGTKMHNFGTLGGSFANALQINNEDEIVGWSLIKGDQVNHAFVCIGGVMSDLNNLVAPSNWTLTYANGVNDSGVIVATGTYAGETHAFLLTPNQTAAAAHALASAPPPVAAGSDLISAGGEDTDELVLD